MAHLMIGTPAELAAISEGDCSDNDTAYIFINRGNSLMVFDDASTEATDTANHPYKIRPDDYDGDGVWIEEVPESFTGGLNSYVEWVGGTLKIRLASGESFDLYGSLNVYAGADITLAGADSGPGKIVFDGSSYNVQFGINAAGSAFEITPDSDNVVSLQIGGIVAGPFGANKYWTTVQINATGSAGLNSNYDASNSAVVNTSAAAAGVIASLVIKKTSTKGVYLAENATFTTPAFYPSPTATINLGGSSNRWNNVFARGLQIITSATLGQAGLYINQSDDNEPMIDLVGTTEAGASKSLSSWTAGNSIQGFFLVSINGTDRWVPYLDAPTS